MKTRYVYWQQDNAWLGYLEEFPDYWTQGNSLAEPQEHWCRNPETKMARRAEINERPAKHIFSRDAAPSCGT